MSTPTTVGSEVRPLREGSMPRRIRAASEDTIAQDPPQGNPPPPSNSEPPSTPPPAPQKKPIGGGFQNKHRSPGFE